MKHLTYDDRLCIQRGLKNRYNFSQIAAQIGKDRSTVSREIKAHRIYLPHEQGNICRHRKTCRIPARCEKGKNGCLNIHRCRTACGVCNESCPDFEQESCFMTDKAPYICNGCTSRCYLGKWKYDAKAAQLQAEEKLHESRKGISLSDDDLEFLNKNIVPLIKNGISVPAACEAYRDQMPVCSKTIYSYIERKIFELDNLDLRLKVRRPMRKKSGPERKVDKDCFEGRTYADYLEYMRRHPDAVVCQMDTVEGRKGGKVLLTLYFQHCGLQLLYIRKRNDSASVTEIFKRLRKDLGEDFYMLFDVILTDRGTEFSNPKAIEYNEKTGRRDCRVFYCDAGRPDQKAECEKNHELIRYIFPKGYSLDKFEQKDVQTAMNHINSYPRLKWGVKSPYRLFEKLYGPQVARKLGLVGIELDCIILRPDLLKQR